MTVTVTMTMTEKQDTKSVFKLAEAICFSDENSDAVCFPYKILSGKVEVEGKNGTYFQFL